MLQGGKRVQMKYVGRLASNGKVFDQTKGSKPFTFRLGVGEVIKVCSSRCLRSPVGGILSLSTQVTICGGSESSCCGPRASGSVGKISRCCYAVGLHAT